MTLMNYFPGGRMDGEGESGEEGLRAAAAAAAAAAGAWTTATYQTGELSNVVHIIVPDLTCIPQSKYVHTTTSFFFSSRPHQLMISDYLNLLPPFFTHSASTYL